MLLWLWLACSDGGDTNGEADVSGRAADDTAGEASADTAGDTAADTAGDTGAPVDVPAFGYLYPALGESCGGCHTSEYVGAFFVEDDVEATHDRLLTRPPNGDPDARYVVPGDPDASLLLQKLTSQPPFGGTMPPYANGAPPLTPAMEEALRAWIVGGAPLP